MSNRILNFCPFCGRKLPKSIKNKTNFCCFCGRRFRNTRYSFTQIVQCTICHKIIDPIKDKTINCSFCGSSYHSTCVSSWLQKYNACPMCQNVFLFPNRTLLIY